MPRNVEIGFLEEGGVAAPAELIRRLLQPTSKSLPHITLRHTSREVAGRWGGGEPLMSQVHLRFDGVTTFDSQADGSQVRTVVVRCSSEELDLRSYKPDFPTSIPHITLYDGAPSELAARALRLLTNMRWRRAVEVALHVYSSSREALQHSTAESFAGILLTSAARDLLQELFRTLHLDSASRVDQLPDGDRLALVELSARALLEQTHSLPPHAPHSQPQGEASQSNGQLAFWTPEEVWAITGAGPTTPRVAARENSAFATPPDLALDVAGEVGRLIPSDVVVDFGDPAAGNGVLLAAARSVLGSSRVQSARVVELDRIAARLFRDRWSHTNTTLVEADFLQISPEPTTWSLVLANPPYRRSQVVAGDLTALRKDLSQRLDMRISARSDLYVYFLLRAHAWMRDGAIAAWILPAEYQVTNYGAAVRQYLTSHAEVIRIHTYDASSPVFDNALTSTSVVVFRKTPARSTSLVTVSQGGTISEPHATLTRNIEFLRRLPRWNFSAVSELGSDTDYNSIGDFFDVRRGIATGSNGHFVLEAAQLQELGASRRWVRPLLPRSRDVAGGVILADHNGDPVPSSDRWLIDTAEPLEVIAAESPRFADYLRQVNREAGGRALVARRTPFWKQEERTAPAFVFASMAKIDSAQPRFLRNLSNGAYLNNYVGLYPRADLSSLTIDTEAFLAQAHQALLGVTNDELMRRGRLYGKGLLKLEPGDLSRVRLDWPVHN